MIDGPWYFFSDAALTTSVLAFASVAPGTYFPRRRQSLYQGETNPMDSRSLRADRMRAPPARTISGEDAKPSRRMRWRSWGAQYWTLGVLPTLVAWGSGTVAAGWLPSRGGADPGAIGAGFGLLCLAWLLYRRYELRAS